MQTEYLLAFALIFALDSVSPGPAVATVIAKGSTLGLARTMPFIAGLVLGDLALFVLAVAGLVALAAALGPLFAVVKWVGIAYLLWLAWRLWHATPVEVSASRVAGEGWRLFGVGCLMPFGNPKAVGFYVALLPTVIDVAEITWQVAVPFSLVIVVVWTGVLAAYAACAERAGHLLTSESARRWLNRGAAGAIVGAAGTIAVRQ